MSGGFPFLGSLTNAVGINDLVSPPTRPIQLTAPGSINTKGAYLQLTASTTNDTVAMMLKAALGGLNGSQGSIDIAVGAGGLEQIIAADIFFSTANVGGADYNGVNVLLPLQVPAGSRIAARYQAANTSTNAFVALDLFDGGFTQSQAGALIEPIGFTAGTTASTTMTPGGSSTKGAYAPLTTSTTYDYAGFLIDMDGSGFTGTGGGNTYVDIAIGAGGSEQIILPNYYVRLGTAATPNLGGNFMPVIGEFFPIHIPAGSRVSARCATDTTATAIGIVLSAVRQ